MRIYISRRERDLLGLVRTVLQTWGTGQPIHPHDRAVFKECLDGLLAKLDRTAAGKAAAIEREGGQPR